MFNFKSIIFSFFLNIIVKKKCRKRIAVSAKGSKKCKQMDIFGQNHKYLNAKQSKNLIVFLMLSV